MPIERGVDELTYWSPIMKRITSAAVLVFALMLVGTASMLSACHTMAGAGQDIQEGGKSLENSANGSK
jgi:predicted small secreted protein